MTFQTQINRAYSVGVPGDIVREGPYRAKSGRIISASGNHFSRAFTFVSESAGFNPTSTTNPAPSPSAALSAGVADAFEVTVGGGSTATTQVFFGILGNPKEHASYGGTSGALSPTLDLPQYSEASFFDMVTGMVVELFNEGVTAKSVNYGDSLYFVTSAYTPAAGNPPLPLGALVSFPAGATVPAGLIAVPNGIISGGSQSLAAGSATIPVLGLVIAQTTE